MAVEGLPFIGKLSEYISRKLYATVNKVGASKAALDVVNRGFYAINPLTTPYIVEAGSDDNLLVLTGHPAKPGDVIRLLTTTNPINEFEIVIDEIVDANTIKLAGYLSASLTAGDTFHILRPIMELMSSDGASLASIVSPPIQFNRLSGGVTTPTTVLQDIDTPANSRPLPVMLYGFSGNITVTANELNIASIHTNDSIAIGNGDNVTPRLMQVDADRNAYFSLRSGTNQAGIDASGNVYSALRDGANASQVSANRNLYVTPRFFDGATNNEWNVDNTGSGLVRISGQSSLATDLNLRKIKYTLNGDPNVIVGERDLVPASEPNAANAASIHGYTRGLVSLNQSLNANIGAQSDAAETNPANADTLIAFVKGLLTRTNDLNSVLGLTNDGAYNDSDGSDSGTISGVARGQFVQQANMNAVLGAINNPHYTDDTGAASGTLNALLKGLFVYENSVFGSETSTNSISTHNAVSASMLELLRGLHFRLANQFPSALGSQLTANSFSVVPSQEYANGNALKVADALATTGTSNKGTLADTNTITINAPVGIVTGFILKNLSNSDGILHWELGVSANVSSSDMVGGQGSAFIPYSGSVTLYAEGACNYALQWFTR